MFRSNASRAAPEFPVRPRICSTPVFWRRLHRSALHSEALSAPLLAPLDPPDSHPTNGTRTSACDRAAGTQTASIVSVAAAATVRLHRISRIILPRLFIRCGTRDFTALFRSAHRPSRLGLRRKAAPSLAHLLLPLDPEEYERRSRHRTARVGDHIGWSAASLQCIATYAAAQSAFPSARSRWK